MGVVYIAFCFAIVLFRLVSKVVLILFSKGGQNERY